jgi:prepilin-type N-terminal cleavage/methylation domain-containing protein
MFIKRLDTRRSGLSLMEMMVAMGVGSVLLMVMGTFAMWSGRSFAALANYAELDNASRNALDVMTRDIREVKSLSTYSTNELKFVDADGISFLYYRYSPGAKTLSRVKNGETQVLLKRCDVMDFRIYQRNTSNQTYNQFPTAANNPATTKVVQLSWTCSRRVLANLNTESVQTAKIVIRNERAK